MSQHDDLYKGSWTFTRVHGLQGSMDHKGVSDTLAKKLTNHITPHGHQDCLGVPHACLQGIIGNEHGVCLAMGHPIPQRLCCCIRKVLSIVEMVQTDRMPDQDPDSTAYAAKATDSV